MNATETHNQLPANAPRWAQFHSHINGVDYFGRFADSDSLPYVWEPCPRCGGRGLLPFSVEGGRCFQCGGNSHNAITGQTGHWVAYAPVAKKALARQRRQDRARAKAAAENAARLERLPQLWDALIADQPLLAMLRDATETGDEILWELRNKFQMREALSVAQINLANTIIKRQAAKAAELEQHGPAPIGVVTLTGEVLSIKEHESTYGYDTTWCHKWTIKTAEGWTVWGTMPARMFDKVEKGSMVTFTAELIEPQARYGQEVDPAFRIGKRFKQIKVNS